MLNNYNLIILHLSLTVPRSLSRCKKVRKLRNYQNKKVVWLDPIYWDTYVTKSLLRSQFAVKKPLYHKVQKAHCKYFMDCVKYEYESLFLNKWLLKRSTPLKVSYAIFLWTQKWKDIAKSNQRLQFCTFQSHFLLFPIP